MDIDLEYHKKQLNDKGYTIIPDVYTQEDINIYCEEFNKWRANTSDLDRLHNLIDYNGIYKHHRVGQQRFAWLARTNKKIQDIFKYLWYTDDIVTSFDGCCYYPSDYRGNPTYWTHTDQASTKKGLWCYQSFLSLTSNKSKTLVVYEYSHLLHEHYFKTMNIESNRDWNIIDETYSCKILDHIKILDVPAGALVVWDSRLFHQNTCGNLDCMEERLIQYLCFLPRYDEKNTEEQNIKRHQYFNNIRTTSHWPYPLNAVPEQPNVYNYRTIEKINIDYSELPKPELSDIIEDIYKII
tara:strand:- start:2069 stop:2956 length:888 start_codon:yes stop_codon:yes gene_type:complete